jgi:hypothetical protein
MGNGAREEFRSIYVLVKEDTDFTRSVKALWEGRLPQGDPLRELLEPHDLRGEVAAWGAVPHLTVLDARTTADPEAFACAVRGVCRRSPRPTIRPEGLAVLGRNSLVVRCASPELEDLRAALAEAVQHLIVRARLTDEEFQRAAWWIRRVGQDVAGNLALLEEARQRYLQAGAPPLPSARHFRLGYLVRLVKDIQAAGNDRAAREDNLRYFLIRGGEPFWHAHRGTLHVTIASLTGGRALTSFSEALQKRILADLDSFEPDAVAIMGEDPDQSVTVAVWDALTETVIEETRPGFKVMGYAEFASPQ